jgi:hypothetical protein
VKLTIHRAPGCHGRPQALRVGIRMQATGFGKIHMGNTTCDRQSVLPGHGRRVQRYTKMRSRAIQTSQLRSTHLYLPAQIHR